MRASRGDLVVGRVIHEDDDHITIEFGKRDDVTFHIAPLSEDDPPAEMHTVLFVHQVGGRAEAWRPWEHR